MQDSSSVGFNCGVSATLHNSVSTMFYSVQTRLHSLPRKPSEIMIQASVFSELVPIFLRRTTVQHLPPP